MAETEPQHLTRIRRNLLRRADVLSLIRIFFRGRGFLEVETPLRAPAIAPEANIAPFTSEGWFLVTSPELYMKRLMAAGYQRLFQVSPCFRKGERGRQHNPEFTMLEWYRQGTDYAGMIEDTEQLVLRVVRDLKLGASITYQGNKIDLTPPWPRLTVRDAFLRWGGWDPVSSPDAVRFDLDLVEKVFPAFEPNRPTVLVDYPAGMASLARIKPGDPGVAERAEVFIGGLELANAYSELNDADEQRRRFLAESEQVKQERGIIMPLPEPFLEAVTRLPACGGIALGVDRLVMLLCDAASIDDVKAFTAETA